MARRALAGYAKTFTKHRLSEVERALADPELISLRNELVVVDQRLEELGAKRATNESRAAWEQINVHLAQAGHELLQPQPELPKVLVQLDAIRNLVSTGIGDYAHWDEVTAMMDVRRRFADTERKYEELRESFVSLTALALLFDDLHGAIIEIIPEPEVRWRLLGRLAERLNGQRLKPAVPLALPAGFVPAPSALDAPGDDPGRSVDEDHGDGDEDQE